MNVKDRATETATAAGQRFVKIVVAAFPFGIRPDQYDKLLLAADLAAPASLGENDAIGLLPEPAPAPRVPEEPKACSDCEEVKDLCEFRFVEGEYQDRCRACEKAETTQAPRAPAKPAADAPTSPVPEGQKRCAKCGEVRALDEFGYDKDGKMKYPCKKCRADYQRDYHRKNNSQKAKETAAEAKGEGLGDAVRKRLEQAAEKGGE